jgi:hypothetical protein
MGEESDWFDLQAESLLFPWLEDDSMADPRMEDPPDDDDDEGGGPATSGGGA